MEIPAYAGMTRVQASRGTPAMRRQVHQQRRKGEGIPDREFVNGGEEMWDKRNSQFANRLFDHDTLLLQEYNINFLYVLKTYTSKHSSLREEFKEKARKKFRDDFLDLLDKHYVFYAVWSKESQNDFVNAHFRTLAGKIIKPVGFGCLNLALEQDSTNDSDVISMWAEIEKECEMIARVTPREIWNDGSDELEEATINTVFYDERMHGFFVDGAEFKKAEIGKKSKLPKYLMGKPMEGSSYVKLGFPPPNSILQKKTIIISCPVKETLK